MLCSILETGTCAHVASLNSGDHRACGLHAASDGDSNSHLSAPAGYSCPLYQRSQGNRYISF